MSKERPGFSHEIKATVRERQNNTCAICGSVTHLSIHHKTPYFKTHDNSYENLVGLCRGEKTNNCHDKVDHLTLDCGIAFEQIMEEGLDYLLQVNPMKQRG